MIAFLIQRILQSIAVLLAVSAVAFTLFRFAGDPVNMMVAEDDTAARRAEVRQSLGLDQPIPVQYARFVHQRRAGRFGCPTGGSSLSIDLLTTRSPSRWSWLRRPACSRSASASRLACSRRSYRGRWIGGLIQTVSLIGISIPGFPGRHLPDHDLRRDAQLAAGIRPQRAELADPACHHARPVPAHIDHVGWYAPR